MPVLHNVASRCDTGLFANQAGKLCRVVHLHVHEGRAVPKVARHGFRGERAEQPDLQEAKSAEVRGKQVAGDRHHSGRVSFYAVLPAQVEGVLLDRLRRNLQRSQ